MSVLQALRDQLVTDLGALGVPVHAAWPIVFDAPCAFVMPATGSSYVAAGPNFCQYTLSVDVVLVSGHAQPEQSLAALEDLIQATLANTMDWKLNGIESPSPATVAEGGAEYLTTAVHLSKPFTLQ